MLMQDEYLVRHTTAFMDRASASHRAGWLTTRKGEWVESCLASASRSPEISWEQFTALGRTQAWPLRLNPPAGIMPCAWYKVGGVSLLAPQVRPVFRAWAHLFLRDVTRTDIRALGPASFPGGDAMRFRRQPE